jgi:hypothetical protein
MIEEATEFAHAKTGAERIYGDTDSIFIRFPDERLSVKQVFEKCYELEKEFMFLYPGNEDNPNKVSSAPTHIRTQITSFSNAFLCSWSSRRCWSTS